MNEVKPFCISTWEVWEAYKRIKPNQGAARVDEQSIADFESDLIIKETWYKILESDIVVQLFSAAGADGEDTESKRWGKEAGHPTVEDRIANRW